MTLDRATLQALEEGVSPLHYLEARDYLQAVYDFLKARLNRYSYVQFAQDCGFSATNVLYLVVKGQRPLSVKAAERIMEGLDLHGLQKNYFRVLVEHRNAATAADKDDLLQRLVALKSQSLDSLQLKSQLDFFSEWHHVAVYELMHLVTFRSDPDWIAGHLLPKIRPEQARKSLQLLESLGLARFDKEKGRHAPTRARVSTGDEIASVAVIRYHHKMIDIAKDAITTVSETERDVSSISIAVPGHLVSKLKDEVAIFRKRILAIAEQARSPDAVYQMNIQLFPVTKTIKEA